MIFDRESPGVTLNEVAQIVDSSTIEKLVSRNVLDVLGILEDGELQRQEVEHLLPLIVDLNRLSRTTEGRRTLIGVLPDYKVEELLDRVVANDREEIIAHPEESQIAALIGFFGGRYEAIEKSETLQDIARVRPSYGLFPHQQRAAAEVEHLLARSLDPRPAVMLHMPTGSGKTRTANHIIARHLESRQRSVVLWLASVSELLEQAADEFIESWGALGNRPLDLVRYWGRVSRLDEAPDGLIVAGFQKMYALLKRDPEAILRLADRISLIIVDEAHISLATTYRELIDILRKTPGTRLLGLSATPGRTWNNPKEDRLLAEIYKGNKVMLEIPEYDSPLEYLFEEGYLARPTFRILKVEEVTARSEIQFQDDVHEEDYSDKQIDAATSSASYLQAVVEAVEDLVVKHQRILIFAASVARAREISSLLRVKRIASDVVTGETPRGLRQAIIQRFRSGAPEPRVLINYGVLTTGFDAPNASACIIARPTRSLVLYSQMVGRVLRGPKAGGNDTADVVTIVNANLPGFGDVTEAFLNWEDVW